MKADEYWWKEKEFQTRKRKIMEKISFKSSFTGDAAGKETIFNALVSGIGFDPIYREGEKKIEEGGRLFDIEQKDVNEAINRTDLGTLVMEPIIRDKLKILPCSLLMEHVLHTEKELPKTEKIRTSLSDLKTVKEIWEDPDSNNLKMHISDMKNYAQLSDEQIDYIQDYEKERIDVDYKSILSRFSDSKFFNTNPECTRSSIELRENEIGKKKQGEPFDKFGRFFNLKSGTWIEYSASVLKLAFEILEKNKENTNDLELLLTRACEIASWIRSYGVYKRKDQNLCENLQRLFTKGMVQVNGIIKDGVSYFWVLYDIFYNCGVHGLFFFGENPKEEAIPEHIKEDIYDNNKELTRIANEKSKEELDPKDHIKINKERLVLIGSRICQILFAIEDMEEPNLTQMWDRIIDVISNEKLDSETIKLSLWDNITEGDEMDAFKHYQIYFKCHAYRFLVTYIGGIMEELPRYFKVDSVSCMGSKMRFIEGFKMFMESLYLLSSYIDENKTDLKSCIDESLHNFYLGRLTSKLKKNAKKNLDILQQSSEFKAITAKKWKLCTDELGKTLKKSDECSIIEKIIKINTTRLEEFQRYSHTNKRDFLKLVKNLFFDAFVDEMDLYFKMRSRLYHFYRSHNINLPKGVDDYFVTSKLLKDLGYEEDDYTLKCNVLEFFLKKEMLVDYRKKRNASRLKDKEMRTYRIGLRVPNELREPFNELVQQREVLQAILRHRKTEEYKNGKNFHGFESFKKLGKFKNISPEKWKKYEKLYKSTCLKRNIQKKLKDIDKKMKVLKVRQYSVKNISKDVFKDLHANTQFPNMSIHDYEHLGCDSLIMTCKNLNNVAVTLSDRIPYDQDEMIEKALKEYEKMFESKGVSDEKIAEKIKKQKDSYKFKLANAIAQIIPEDLTDSLPRPAATYNQIAYDELIGRNATYCDTIKKLDVVKNLFFNSSTPSNEIPDFSDAAELYLYSYNIPKHLRIYLSHAMKTSENTKSNGNNLDTQWVRNILVGWRRKVDKCLPKTIQIEPITESMEKIAEKIKSLSLSDKEVQVVGKLQKKQILHLINTNLDLTPLLKKELHNSYHTLKQKIAKSNLECGDYLKGRITKFTHKEINSAIHILITRVINTRSEYEPDEQRYKNCSQFLRKVELVRDNFKKLKFVWRNFIPGNRYTSDVAKLFAALPEVKKIQQSRFYTAIRGIMAIAYAQKYPGALVEFENVFTPENCLTRPFKSKNRKRNQLPYACKFNRFGIRVVEDPFERVIQYGVKKYKIITLASTTELLLAGKTFWIGIEIFNEKAFSNGFRNKGGKGRCAGVLFYEFKPSKKILQCLKRGAYIKSLRLIPQGHSGKILVDVTLTAATKNSYTHNSKFLLKWDELHNDFTFPQSKYIGCDLNTLGENTIAVGVPSSEIDIRESPIMKAQKKAREKLDLFRKKEIPALQKKIINNPENSGRQKTQLNLIYQKIRKISKFRKQEALMMYLYAGKKVGAEYFAWDAVNGIETKGKKGNFANSITLMPKNAELFDILKEWAIDLKKNNHLSEFKKLIPVSPYSSQVCGACYESTGEKKRTKDNSITDYHTFKCKQCNHMGNRHSNAARVEAIELKHYIQSNP